MIQVSLHSVGSASRLGLFHFQRVYVPVLLGFLVTVSLTSEFLIQVKAALQLLSDNSALRMVGARIRQERSHRPLPKDLRDIFRDSRT